MPQSCKEQTMARDWQEWLSDKKILLSDGAWGTEFSKRGLGAGQAPEALNLSDPDTVRNVAKSYVDAGADIVLTNSFGGNPFKLEKAGLGNQVEEINRQATALSREAAGERALVFGSIGPSGEFLEPIGTLKEGELVTAFAKQAKALAEGGADAIVIETMSDLAEAKAALKAVREATSLPAVTCMTYQKGPGGLATMMGVKPHDAAREFDEAGADIIGANCGAGIADMTDVVQALRSATSKPIWAKANAGLPELVDGETVYRESPESMAENLPRLLDAGANLVGGCCGTGPEHIRALSTAIRKYLDR